MNLRRFLRGVMLRSRMGRSESSKLGVSVCDGVSGPGWVSSNNSMEMQVRQIFAAKIHRVPPRSYPVAFSHLVALLPGLHVILSVNQHQKMKERSSGRMRSEGVEKWWWKSGVDVRVEHGEWSAWSRVSTFESARTQSKKSSTLFHKSAERSSYPGPKRLPPIPSIPPVRSP